MKKLKNGSSIISIFSILLFLFFIKDSLRLPFYWDSSAFLIPAAQEIAANSSILEYTKEMTDYPHTFLFPLVLSFFFKVSSYPLISIHVFSILISLFFLFLMIKISEEFKYKYLTPFLLLSFATNPLFISQTDLVYFEIIGSLFKFTAIYYLSKEKYKKFAISSIVAFLIRFENGFVLPILGSIFYFFIKKNKQLLIAILSVTSITFTWFLTHYLLTGWWLYSPERYFDENHTTALIESIKYLFLWQGRYAYTLVGLIGLLNLVFQKLKYKKNIQLPSHKLLLLLFLSTVPIFSIIFKLGYFIPRYIFPALPIFYILVFLLTQTFSKKINKLFLVILLLLPLIQTTNFNSCYSHNFEDCIYLRELLNNKKRAVKYLNLKYSNHEEIYTYFEDDNSLNNTALGYTDKKLNVVTEPSKNTDIIYITPTSGSKLYAYAKKNNFKLEKQFSMNREKCFQPNFLIKNCQNNINNTIFIFTK